MNIKRMYRWKALVQVPRQSEYEKKYASYMYSTKHYTLAKRFDINEFSDDQDSDSYWFVWFKGDPPFDVGDQVKYFDKLYMVVSLKIYGRNQKGLVELEH